MTSEQENRFLTDRCHPFISSLMQQNLISDWFFVRYADPKPHVRLRFLGDQERIYKHLLHALHNWAKTLLQEGLIRDMALGSYEREIERYGGAALIESAEAIFCADSAAAMILIRGMTTKKITLAEETIAALSLIDLLKGLGLHAEAQLAFFSSFEMPKEELKGFRQSKIDLVALSKKILEGDETGEPALLWEAFHTRRESLHAFANKMLDTTPAHRIQDSLLHMHCNRLLGRNEKKELKARLYAHHTLKILSSHTMAITGKEGVG